jgi:FtsP/CotA-like multicopper oxidase with cupredoxin domain
MLDPRRTAAYDRAMRARWASLCLLLLLGCDTAPASREVTNGWDLAAPLQRVRATEPGLLELDLVAAPARWTFAPGRAVDGYAYNGTVPGPLIEARVGDTLVVRFRNDLPEPTTIHWHGLRVPAEMDGGPHSQDPIPPGGTFEYRFPLLDAGTFWYHPHVDEPRQMELGLYGAIVVRDEDEPVVDSEAVLILDDLLLDESGALLPFGGLLEVHGGREGNVQLVNGTMTPAVAARSGERQRWRVINAGSARFYRLRLTGHSFTVLGTDGGRSLAPQTTDELFLVPGDRVDVIVDLMGAPEEIVELTNEPYSRGHGSGVFEVGRVATIELGAEAALPPLEALSWVRSIEWISESDQEPREVVFSESLDAATETVTFRVNGEVFPDVTPIAARVGEVEVWELVNESEMDHPFHLHGFFFQVLSRDGVRLELPSWEDTIPLHGHERVRIVFRPDDRPGMWMFHCHILEHVENGMMGVLHVGR